MHRTITRKTVSLLGLAALALTFLAGPAAHANQTDEKVFKQTMPAMTWVLSPLDNKGHVAMGSGALVIVNGEVLVLTACHVVDDRPNVLLFFPARNANGRFIRDPDYYKKNMKTLGVRGQVVYKSHERDVALIRPERIPAGVKPLALAALRPRAGETVHAIGNSMSYDGDLWRYRAALVESVGTTVVKYGDRKVEARMIRLKAYIDHGDSGGPVVNEAGEVVGVISGGNLAAWREFAIDVTEVRQLAGAGKAPTRTGTLAGGTWECTTTRPDGARFVQTFRPDGTVTVQLIDANNQVVKRMEMTYRMEGGRLIYVAAGQTVIEAEILWTGSNGFTVTTTAGTRDTWVRK